MNNETSNPLIQLISEETIQVQTYVAASVLVFYASLIRLDDEVQYIWMQHFTLATLLYIFSKYALFLSLVLGVVAEYIPSTRICNDLGFLIDAIILVAFIGIQGFISIRTYALCQGYRPVAVALFTTFFIALSLHVYVATIPACVPTPSYVNLITLIANVTTVLEDMIAFIVVIRQVRGLWKEKRSVGLQSNDDLVTLLLEQGTLRFSFVLFITITSSLSQYIFTSVRGLGAEISTFQNVVSVLLICEFTLDLRRRNETRALPNQSALELPTISLSFRDDPIQPMRSVFGRIHESIMADMGERNGPVDVGGMGQEERDEELSA